ncbi:hypothetical protein HYALB_00002260 [Hymenoscyphus albidus]|uniref:Uncharacterized protein n=1 Tax=Hymenoscyphus albidus TaxID=595503 RepID=A0A9N9M1I2_9HELO|nr:hypothetical protein HYALB_00002260 [Hymenoscyphus albidus]
MPPLKLHAHMRESLGIDDIYGVAHILDQGENISEPQSVVHATLQLHYNHGNGARENQVYQEHNHSRIEHTKGHVYIQEHIQ